MKKLTILLILTSLLSAEPSPQEQFDLGMQYLLGDGVKQDKQKAAIYLQKSSDQGDAEAQYNLALMYYLGDGVKQDVAKTLTLLERSAKQGYQKAIDNVGRIAMQIMKFDKALYWLKINAKNGDLKANYLIAEIYINKEDLKNAKIYAQKAIDSGDEDAKVLWKEYKLANY